MVEIGTHQGVSAVLLAEYAKEVHTIDVTDYPDRTNIWHRFGTKNVIFHLIKDDKEKAKILKNLEFDFAFVDGRHGDTAAIDDFNLVKHCGRVLFHDYHKGFDYDNIRSCVVRAVDSITDGHIYRCEPFAYWTKECQHYNTTRAVRHIVGSTSVEATICNDCNKHLI
jgi:hypothetical protein